MDGVTLPGVNCSSVSLRRGQKSLCLGHWVALAHRACLSGIPVSRAVQDATGTGSFPLGNMTFPLGRGLGSAEIRVCFFCADLNCFPSQGLCRDRDLSLPRGSRGAGAFAPVGWLEELETPRSQFCWESNCTSNPGHLPLAAWEWQGLGWSESLLCYCWYHALSWMASLWQWAGFGKAPHSPQPAPCGLWAEAGASGSAPQA